MFQQCGEEKILKKIWWQKRGNGGKLHFSSSKIVFFPFQRESPILNSLPNNKISDLSELKAFADYNHNSLPNAKILDVTKLKAFADKKLNIAKMMISL